MYVHVVVVTSTEGDLWRVNLAVENNFYVVLYFDSGRKVRVPNQSSGAYRRPSATLSEDVNGPTRAFHARRKVFLLLFGYG